jgi:3-isopropylmalate/(R)-2-methylmalate dehydratase small subunit
MQPFTTLTGIAVPMIEDDINTDQIAPLQLARGLEPDWGELLFKRQRIAADGTLTDHILNHPNYQRPSILVAGRNFGCGSSRESAVWCLMGIGIGCVIARSIADIFRENCIQNGLLPIELADLDGLEAAVLASNGTSPFTVDLPAQTIIHGTAQWSFDISASDKLRLIEGLDEIGLTMKHEAEIRAFEARLRAESPWLQQARDLRQS